MTRKSNWGDLEAIQDVEKQIHEIRRGLQVIPQTAAAKGVLDLLDQLEDAVADIAADVEADLNERNPRKRR